MKRTALIIFFSLCIYVAFGAFGASKIFPSNDPKVNKMMIPLVGTNQFISLEEYYRLTPKSYRQLTGEKMSFKERVLLADGKKMLKKTVSKDGNVKIQEFKKGGFFGNWSWHWGGFALGLFLSVLGPIVALFYNDDYKWDRFRTALWTSTFVLAILIKIILLTV